MSGGDWKEVTDWRSHLNELLTENSVVGKVNDWADDVPGGTELRRCRCESKPGQPKCVDDSCFNRGTQTECDPEKCGTDCCNNRFQFQKFAQCVVVDAGDKGYGLVTKQELAPGDMVYEYFGELIDGKEFQRRRSDGYASKKHLFMLELKERKGRTNPNSNPTPNPNSNPNPNPNPDPDSDSDPGPNPNPNPNPDLH